ncbi:acyl-CoA dehydrogenase family protein [Amycolatopsis samaneae]|uniref:Acyl-CoA dehydrogenase family protein n=1 Tax=Amycolatopsis samaneae TaxID=664691 RepID=A0ABW5GSZ9_9PSEU
MDLLWNERQAAAKERYRRFGLEVVAPLSAERDRAGTFNETAWKELAAAGFWRANVPARFGGDGGTLWDLIAGFEGLTLGAQDCGFVLSAIAHAGLVQVLLTHGTDDQRARLLPRLMSGGVGATAATEPTGGSHVAAIGTRAVRTPSGFLLTGRKAHITNAPIADLVLIVARVADIGKRDITLFVLDAAQDGVSLGDSEDLLGQRTSPTGPIELAGATVPDRDVVGPVGEGLTTLYSFLAFDRIMYGIVVAALLESLLPKALDRISTRSSFGVPLAEHELIQDKIVGIKMTIESARALSYSAVDALQRGDESFSALASCAKLTASEGVVNSALELVQLFGHRGYDREFGIERHLRDAVAIRIAGGTSEMQKKNIFKHALSEHLEASNAGR